MHNRPVLATPVGGLCELVEPGRSGWLARDSVAAGAGATASSAWPTTARAIRALIDVGRAARRASRS